MSGLPVHNTVQRCGTCKWYSHGSVHYATRCKLAAAMPSVNRTQGVTEHHGTECPGWTTMRQPEQQP